MATITTMNPIRSQMDRIAEAKKTQLIVVVNEQTMHRMLTLAEKVAPFAVAIIIHSANIMESGSRDEFSRGFLQLRETSAHDKVMIMVTEESLHLGPLGLTTKEVGLKKTMADIASWAGFLTDWSDDNAIPNKAFSANRITPEGDYTAENYVFEKDRFTIVTDQIKGALRPDLEVMKLAAYSRTTTS